MKLAVLVLLVETGCLQAIAPDVGPLASACTGAACPDSAVCSNADSNRMVTISYATDLGRIFQHYGCKNCHTGGGIGVQQSGFDLSTYAKLRTGGGRSGQTIVVDFMPCASILAQKLGTSPPFGRRMPYNGPPYLTPADLQIVTDWIAEGARDN